LISGIIFNVIYTYWHGAPLGELLPFSMRLLIRAALAPRPFARTTMLHRWRWQRGI
jgi:hypothetical protein